MAEAGKSIKSLQYVIGYMVIKNTKIEYLIFIIYHGIM